MIPIWLTAILSISSILVGCIILAAALAELLHDWKDEAYDTIREEYK